jgi:pimeloyl-ACP methyl ester carboxylesterase
VPRQAWLTTPNGRAESDEALARQLLVHGVEAFVAEWERQPLLEPAPHVSPQRRALQHAQRLHNRPLGLANSLRGMGAGAQRSLWPSVSDLRMPVCLIVGERDARYCEVAARMRERVPTAELSVVPEAGHTVHVDQPRHFANLVATVLDNKLTHPTRRC